MAGHIEQNSVLHCHNERNKRKKQAKRDRKALVAQEAGNTTAEWAKLDKQIEASKVSEATDDLQKLEIEEAKEIDGNPKRVTDDLNKLLRKQIRDPCFEIQSIPGRGLGLVARKDIKKLDTIMREDSIMKTDEQNPFVKEAAFMASSAEKKALFLSLSQRCVCEDRENCSETTVRRIWNHAFKFNINAPDGQVIEKYPASLYLLSTHLNHSCDPNAAGFANEAGNLITFARRDIMAGEEITINYLGVHGTIEERRETVHGYYGYICCCRPCTDGVSTDIPEALDVNHILETNILKTKLLNVPSPKDVLDMTLVNFWYKLILNEVVRTHAKITSFTKLSWKLGKSKEETQENLRKLLGSVRKTLEKYNKYGLDLDILDKEAAGISAVAITNQIKAFSEMGEKSDQQSKEDAEEEAEEESEDTPEEDDRDEDEHESGRKAQCIT